VAGFIGSPPMNFVPAMVENGQVSLPFVTLAMPAPVEHGLLIAGIRPEDFEVAERVDPDLGGCRFSAVVDVVEWLGREQYAYVPFEAPPEIAEKLKALAGELDSDSIRTQLVVEVAADSKIRRGEEANLWFEPEKLMFFDPATGENLSRRPAGANPP
jgi:multiple sugar transport system ATP-binding protein